VPFDRGHEACGFRLGSGARRFSTGLGTSARASSDSHCCDFRPAGHGPLGGIALMGAFLGLLASCMFTVRASGGYSVGTGRAGFSWRRGERYAAAPPAGTNASQHSFFPQGCIILSNQNRSGLGATAGAVALSAGLRDLLNKDILLLNGRSEFLLALQGWAHKPWAGAPSRLTGAHFKCARHLDQASGLTQALLGGIKDQVLGTCGHRAWNTLLRVRKKTNLASGTHGLPGPKLLTLVLGLLAIPAV
jgi:hypothetical protein